MAEPRYRAAAQEEVSPRSSVSSILENINRFDAGDLEKQDDDEIQGVVEPPPKRRWTQSVVKGAVAVVATLLVASAVFAYSTALPRNNRGSTGAASSLVSSVTVSPSSISAASTSHPHSSSSSKSASPRALSLDDWRRGKYAAESSSIQWLRPVDGHSGNDGDGDYLEKQRKNYVIKSYGHDNETTIIEGPTFNYDDRTYPIQRVDLSVDRSRVLIGANIEKNFRHSTFGQYFVYSVEHKSYEPVFTDHADRRIALAKWSPRGDRIAFVYENNLYLRHVGGSTDGQVKQITHDGGEDLFYGVPDWVYEEEVFGDDTAMWWSNSGEYLAFLRTNESQVPTFPVLYYARKKLQPYPEVFNIKYPKPGFGNPVVDLQLLEISSEETYTVETEQDRAQDDLITEVLWAGASKVLVRLTNRVSDILKVSLIDAKARTGSVVRSEDVRGKGWFEVTHDTTFLPKGGNREDDGYIDTVIVDGYNHLAYFSPVDSAEPKTILTSGKWEVVDAPSAVDLKSDSVYFFGTKKSPVERHLYAVDLGGKEIRAVTDTSKDGFYSASFSGAGRFALLSYEGPNVPWQGVIDLHSQDVLGGLKVVESNSRLKVALGGVDLPTSEYSQIEIATSESGEPIVANAVEIKPASFDPSKKYPVLFFVYGGPVSQTVQKRYATDFQKIVASRLDAIVVSVDGRGTGFMGRDFRAAVRDKLGQLEPQDQITAAKNWAARDYVDEDRIAIWGWSYGGFMTLKTLEADAGRTFRHGMAVAPVTDFRLYDSIYTERYMHLPSQNAGGYDRCQVDNATALGQSERFLIMHGTGDDNVHFQNTLVLLDKLDLAGVENYDVHFFPDSDHSIYYHNANTIVYDKLYQWIETQWA